MKNYRKIIIFTILVTFIGFFLISCSDPVTELTLPLLTGTVSITGTAQVGYTLTANTNDLGGSGIINYQWMTGNNVINANNRTYIIQNDDVGSTISVVVTRTENSGSIKSDPVGPVGEYISVTDIAGLPISMIIGMPLELTGTVYPFNTTSQTITWNIIDAGTTGAWINNSNFLHAANVGTVNMKATIVNGIAVGSDFVKYFSITVNPVPNIGIALDITGTYTFAAVTEGYSAIMPLTVWIDNIGNQPTGNLTIALAGTNSSSFTLSRTSITNIAEGNNTSFTVNPITGLAVGTHTASVTVSGGTGISSHSFNITFNVDLIPTYGIILDTTGTHTFSTAMVDYTVITPITIMVDNTGNQQTGDLTVSLSGTNSNSFSLSRTFISSIAVNGNATLTIGPNIGLAAGTYTATVTVSGTSGITERYFSVFFEVKGPTTLWAKTTTAGIYSNFFSNTVDSAGNIYAVGQQSGTVTYGNGVTATGAANWSSSVLVKYDSSGNALWARSVSGFDYTTRFFSVAVDSSGNVYAAGTQDERGIYNYGNGVTAAGSSSASNPVLVKYNASGNALWARTVTTGDDAYFYSVSVDSSGSVYAAGYQRAGTYNYGNGVTATGNASGSGGISVLVKYDSSGNALWARTISTNSGGASFQSVAVDSSGNIYATGGQYGTGTYNYGNSVTATGSSSGYNAILVKYDSTGSTLWARTINAGNDRSDFFSITIDSFGNVYAVGVQNGIGTYNYGNGVTAAGSSSGNNPVIVKYNSSGGALWARTITAGSGNTAFQSISVDSSSNVYAVGFQGTGNINYGNDVTAIGSYSNQNPVLVKYDSLGSAQWAKTISTGYQAVFNAVSVDWFGNVYAAGYQEGNTTFNYGSGVTVTGSASYYSSPNSVLVKYKE